MIVPIILLLGISLFFYFMSLYSLRRRIRNIQLLLTALEDITAWRIKEMTIRDCITVHDEVSACTYGRNLNMKNLYRYFRFRDEIEKIIDGIDDFIARKHQILMQYPFLVSVYPFTFAVRQQESGRKGLEFGIMHPEAKDTSLEIQLEWFLSTLLKDTVRWHTGKLWNNWKKEDFPDFIAYFARKYAPPEASDLNKVWEPNVRKYYAMFRKE